MSNIVMPPATCTVEEAAELLGVGRALAYQLARAGEELAPGCKAIRIGHRLVVPRAPLARALGLVPSHPDPVKEPDGR